MKIAFYSTKDYDRSFFDAANAQLTEPHEIVYFEQHLNDRSAAMAKNHACVCVFVNDLPDAKALKILHEGGTRFIVLRCAGYNNVDLVQARKLGIQVARVPVYSPHAVAEHTIGLILSLNRKIHRAYNRVREGNFSIDSLLGFDLYGKNVGLIGVGRIGQVVAKICSGFGCNVFAYDIVESAKPEDFGFNYTSLERVISDSDIISLHCPLTPDTHHLVSAETIAQMKPGVMLVNTSRGGLVDSRAIISGLKSGKLGSVALDVYEEEGDVFFEDLSSVVLQDDVLARLLTFPNVLVTSHQAFFTREATQKIAATTLSNASCFERGKPTGANSVTG